MILVMRGIVHTATQINAFFVLEVVGMYNILFTVSRVVTEIARTEKSAAETDNWPINPLATHGIPAWSCPVLRNMLPDIELLRVLINSKKEILDF